MPSADECLSPTVQALVETAIEAGRLILGYFGGALAHDTKPDASPVTEADRRAERLIVARLAALLPGVPVVAEEAISDGHVPEALGARFLLVDPLDGTREFVSGNGDFTVNIALVENGRPTHGVVVVPATGEVFFGTPAGAFKGRVGASGDLESPRPIHVRRAGSAPRVVISRSRGLTPALVAFLENCPGAAVEPVGSSLKFCRVAEGAADIYPCLGRTMEWDTAAGQAVLEASGGTVLCLDGAPLAYDKRRRAEDADFANPHFVCRGGAPAAD